MIWRYFSSLTVISWTSDNNLLAAVRALYISISVLAIFKRKFLISLFSTNKSKSIIISLIRTNFSSLICSKRRCQSLYRSSILSFFTMASTLESSDRTGVLAIKFFSLSSCSTSRSISVWWCLVIKCRIMVTKMTATIR